VAAGRAPSSPRVSVIIPVYNAGKDLPEAVESVVSQTFEVGKEIFLVDEEKALHVRAQ
jgi:glycosyltransferase involved in cell wall biosynthesis